jgi:hypothetical protein
VLVSSAAAAAAVAAAIESTDGGAAAAVLASAEAADAAAVVASYNDAELLDLGLSDDDDVDGRFNHACRFNHLPLYSLQITHSFMEPLVCRRRRLRRRLR